MNFLTILIVTAIQSSQEAINNPELHLNAERTIRVLTIACICFFALLALNIFKIINLKRKLSTLEKQITTK